MAREVQAFQVTIPAGTLKSAPQVTNLAMPPRIVREVEVLVPPGPRGLVGFQLAMAGAQLIPYTAGAFIVSDDEKMRWELEGYPSSGAWQCIAYNTGIFDHTLYFRFLVDIPGESVVGIPANIPTGDLNSLLN